MARCARGWAILGIYEDGDIFFLLAAKGIIIAIMQDAAAKGMPRRLPRCRPSMRVFHAVSAAAFRAPPAYFYSPDSPCTPLFAKRGTLSAAGQNSEAFLMLRFPGMG